ncbi:MAG: hypothetical protein ACQETO_13035 [Pseudomonadota bacterium]
MLGIYGYLTSWAIYLAAGTLCYVLFHRATRGIRPALMANLLRAIMIALIYTPWTVAPDQNLMAPAVMVIPLDMITMGADQFVRGMVPLLLAVILAVLGAIVVSVFNRGR